MSDRPKPTQLGLFGGEEIVVKRCRIFRPRTKTYARPDRSPRRRADKGALTCGDCKWLRMKVFSGCDAVHPKCAFTATGGWATTIAYRDAACSRLEAPKPKEGDES